MAVEQAARSEDHPSHPTTCSVVTKPFASSRVATVYVNNGSLGTFKSQLSMNVFTVSGSSADPLLQWRSVVFTFIKLLMQGGHLR